MSSDTGPSTGRPQIQVVRLPSNERAKITLDGVQLRAQYHHFRSGDYIRASAVSSGALDRCADDYRPGPQHHSEELLLRAQDSDPSTHCYHFCLAPRKRNKQRDLITNSVETLLTNNIKNKKQSVLNLSTKSCDNIFEKYFVRSKEKMGVSWKDSTRSEEHLSYVGRKNAPTLSLAKERVTEETSASTGGLAGRLLSRLLRRLQPRHSKRPEAATTPGTEAPATSQPPWIVVSFSRRDVEGDGDTQQHQEAPTEGASWRSEEQRNKEVQEGGSAAAWGQERRRRGPLPHRPQAQFGHTSHHGTPDMHLDSAPFAAQRLALRVPGTRVVPSTSSVQSRHQRGSRRGGGSRLLAPSGALAGQTGRPHTLYLAPSSPANPDDTMENRGTLRKMAASFESIGSCSLDVDITASESSGLLESRGGCGASLSQRTLHSLDSQKLVAHSTEELSTSSSSRHYVKRAAKLFDPTDVSNSDDSVFTPPRSRPSYVSLSCSVSGYTRATNYSSSRLRDPSPCSRQNGTPTPLLLARTSPVLRGGSIERLPIMNGHHSTSTDTVDCATVRMNGRSSKSPSSGDNVMQYSKQTFVSQMGPSSTYNETSVWHSSANRSEGNMSNGAAANTAKSFIQQRVERLYGRGALAQGFFRQTKLISNGNSTAHSKQHNSLNTRSEERTPSSFPELPVLRLLRPEFREQLSISSPHSTPWWRHRQSPPRACNGNDTSTDVNPKEHIIPITLEAEHSSETKERVQQPTVASLSKKDLVNDMVTSISAISVCDVATQAHEAPQDLQPAAPEVVIAVEPLPTSSIPEPDSNVKDGHYFLKLLGVECQRLLAMAAEVEKEYESSPNLSEDVKGKLRAAIGQARLLVRQKLQQFEGLCHRNLAQRSSEEQFPTTCDDLAGFWDMVQLQIAHVDSLFEELDEMRKRGWQEVSPTHTGKNGTSKARRPTPSSTATPKAAPKLSEKAQEAARLRDEQRKKLMEERRRVAKMQKKMEADTVEIFAPNSNS